MSFLYAGARSTSAEVFVIEVVQSFSTTIADKNNGDLFVSL